MPGGPQLKQKQNVAEEAHRKLRTYFLAFNEASDAMVPLAVNPHTTPVQLQAAKSRLDRAWDKLKEAVILYLPQILANTERFGYNETASSKEILQILSREPYDLIYGQKSDDLNMSILLSPGGGFEGFGQVTLKANAGNGKMLLIPFSSGCGGDLIFFPEIYDPKTIPKRQK